MSKKRPAILLYTGDWLRDTALRSCSHMARAIWIDMICYMADCTEYGYLKVGNKVILIDNLAHMLGLSIEDARRYVQELIDAGVCQRTSDGVLYSKRMVEDEQIRLKRATGGHLGGNPALKNSAKDNLKKNKKDNSEVVDKVNLSLENENNNENENVIEDNGGGAGGGNANEGENLNYKIGNTQSFFKDFSVDGNFEEDKFFIADAYALSADRLLSWVRVFCEYHHNKIACRYSDHVNHFKLWFQKQDKALNPEKDFKNGIKITAPAPTTGNHQPSDRGANGKIIVDPNSKTW